MVTIVVEDKEEIIFEGGSSEPRGGYGGREMEGED